MRIKPHNSTAVFSKKVKELAGFNQFKVILLKTLKSNSNFLEWHELTGLEGVSCLSFDKYEMSLYDDRGRCLERIDIVR